MPGFTAGPNYRTPFGRNQYLRSTQDVKTDSRMVANTTVPTTDYDDGLGNVSSIRVLQPGVVMAVITSGADVDLIGPYQNGGAINETVSIDVDATGGTFTITFATVASGAIAFDALPEEVEDALVATTVFGAGDVNVTGGPGVSGGGTPYVLEFMGQYAAQDVGAVTTGVGSLTGGGGTADVTVDQAGSSGAGSGATDGRQLSENIVGINNTFLPWQLDERDVEVAIVYEAAVVQANCLEVNAAGTAFVALLDATKDAMHSRADLDIRFR